jgi:hypothetical protein
MKLKVTSGAFGENGMGEDGCGGSSWRNVLRGLAGKIDRSLCRATHLDVTYNYTVHPQPSFTLHSDITLLFCFTCSANL